MILNILDSIFLESHEMDKGSFSSKVWSFLRTSNQMPVVMDFLLGCSLIWFSSMWKLFNLQIDTEIQERFSISIADSLTYLLMSKFGSIKFLAISYWLMNSELSILLYCSKWLSNFDERSSSSNLLYWSRSSPRSFD